MTDVMLQSYKVIMVIVQLLCTADYISHLDLKKVPLLGR